MQAVIVVIIIGLIGGIAVGLQQPLTNMISQRLGVFESAFIIQFGGAIAAAIPLLVHRGGTLAQWRAVPWYALAGGALGIFVLVGISVAFPRLGAVATTFLIVTGQLVIAYCLTTSACWELPCARLTCHASWELLSCSLVYG